MIRSSVTVTPFSPLAFNPLGIRTVKGRGKRILVAGLQEKKREEKTGRSQNQSEVATFLKTREKETKCWAKLRFAGPFTGGGKRDVISGDHYSRSCEQGRKVKLGGYD